MNIKSIALLGAIIISTLGCANAKNKNVSSDIKVKGNCGSCEKRIEDAAYAAGAKTASWNSDTETLTVVYNPKSDRLQKIENSVLSTGHDVEDKTADTEVYQKLPACCKYRDGACTKE